MGTKPKTALSVLVAARKLISKPEKWAQGYFAKDKNDLWVSVFNERNLACRFCADGAIIFASDGDAAVADTAAGHLRREVRRDIWSWNDSKKRTHPEVLAAFDRAIAKLRKERAQAEG